MDLFKKHVLGEDEFESLFKYITSHELLKFRLVSKTWNALALLALKQRRGGLKLLLTTNNCDCKTNWEFLQFLNDSPDAFVAPVLHIKNTNTSSQYLWEGGTCSTFEIVKKICKILGDREKPTIRHLIIEDGDESPDFDLRFLLAVLRRSPSLETLEISKLMSPGTFRPTSPEFQLPLLKEIILSDRFPRQNYRNFFEMILELTPNLTDVSGNLINVNFLKMLSETGHLPKMQAISLTDQEDLDILLESHPKISLLKLHIEGETWNVKKLQKVLQEQQASLKELKFSPYLRVGGSITLPFLPVLEKLTFCPKFAVEGSFFNLINGRYTPKLKFLHINSDNSYGPCWGVEFFNEGVNSVTLGPCLLLEELQLSMPLRGMNSEVRQNLLDGMKNMFPNVKKVYLDLASEEFKWPVYKLFLKCWPDLVEVAVNFVPFKGIDLDEVLFGLSAEWKGSIDTTRDQWWENVTPPHPGGIITNLKNLRKLEMGAKLPYGTGLVFTDFSVYCGLKYLVNLRKLVVRLRDSTIKVSPAAMDFLDTNLPNLETVGIATEAVELMVLWGP